MIAPKEIVLVRDVRAKVASIMGMYWARVVQALRVTQPRFRMGNRPRDFQKSSLHPYRVQHDSWCYAYLGEEPKAAFAQVFHDLDGNEILDDTVIVADDATFLVSVGAALV